MAALEYVVKFRSFDRAVQPLPLPGKFLSTMTVDTLCSVVTEKHADVFSKNWGWTNLSLVEWFFNIKTPTLVEDWDAQLSSFLDPPPSAAADAPPANTVTFILKPLQSAPSAVSSGVTDASALLVVRLLSELSELTRAQLSELSELTRAQLSELSELTRALRESELTNRPDRSITMSDMKSEEWKGVQTVLKVAVEELHVAGLKPSKPSPFVQASRADIWSADETSTTEPKRLRECLAELGRLWTYVSDKLTGVFKTLKNARSSKALPCVFPSQVKLTVHLSSKVEGATKVTGCGDAYVCCDDIGSTPPYGAILTVDFKMPDVLDALSWLYQGRALAVAHWRRVGRAAVWCTDLVRPGILFLTEEHSTLLLELHPRTYADMVELLVLLEQGDLHSRYEHHFKKHPQKESLSAVRDEDHTSLPGSCGDGGVPPDTAGPPSHGHPEPGKSGEYGRKGEDRHPGRDGNVGTWKKRGDMYCRRNGDSETLLFIEGEVIREQLQSLRGMYKSRAEEKRAIADILNALAAAH